MLSTEYINSVCEIKDIDNNLISTGHIVKIVDDDLLIHFRGSIRRAISGNTCVKINIINDKLGFKVLVGKVYIGSTRFVRVTDVVSVTSTEQRGFFRINISESASLYKEKISVHEITTKYVEHEEVQLYNLCLYGTYFVTNFVLNKDDSIYLYFKINNNAYVFSCVIRRVVENKDINGKIINFGYGCEFIGNSQKQHDDLYKFIIQTQFKLMNINNKSNV